MTNCNPHSSSNTPFNFSVATFLLLGGKKVIFNPRANLTLINHTVNSSLCTWYINVK